MKSRLSQAITDIYIKTNHSKISMNEAVSLIEQSASYINKKISSNSPKDEPSTTESSSSGSRTMLPSLVLTNYWMKTNSQEFHDLITLVRNGIPTKLRSTIWRDLMKTSIIQMEARANLS